MVVGWLFGRYREKIAAELSSAVVERQVPISQDYFIGLSYLINEQPDKAVDVFIKMLEVNSDTVETHLALGSLFRRRGEVSRAIRIHQNLIARPQLSKKQRAQALFELGQDYLRSGVLDRAEKMFLEIIKVGGETEGSLNGLLNIYQQQQEWIKAIAIAKKIQATTDLDMRIPLSHYKCELAVLAKVSGNYKQAKSYLKEALAFDSQCVRASLVLGEILFDEQLYDEAVKTLLLVAKQDFGYISETVSLLRESYLKLGQEEKYFSYLVDNARQYSDLTCILAMVDYLTDKDNLSSAIECLSKHMTKSLSLRGSNKLLSLCIELLNDDVDKPQLQFLQEVVNKIADEVSFRYLCTNCGFSSKSLYWQCPSCKRWNTTRLLDEASVE